jgi:hypothetical protein
LGSSGKGEEQNPLIWRSKKFYNQNF